MEKANLNFIIRDFTEDGLKSKEALLEDITRQVMKTYPGSSYTFTVKEQYRNMKVVLDKNPEIVENGLARLVLSIVELVRRLLEKQAIRRMDNGTLSDEEIERLGSALMKLEEKMSELKRVFGLSDDDLNLKLGPVKTL